MKTKQHIHTNDLVEVTTGEERGKRGKVLQVLAGKDKVIVEGVNYVWKHLKPSEKSPQGGRLEKEAALDLSNVMLVSFETGTAQRTRVVVKNIESADGKTKRCSYRVGVRDGKPISARDAKFADLAAKAGG